MTTNNANFEHKIDRYDDTNKPLIVCARWGNIITSYRGKKYKFRDVMIWPEGQVEWDWRKSETHHDPGIMVKDVKFLVNIHKCNYIILTCGYDNVLKVSRNAIKYLERKKVLYNILNSHDAFIEYNVNTLDRVGILFHSTC